jgi:hypothetical protein
MTRVHANTMGGADRLVSRDRGMDFKNNLDKRTA